MLEAILNSPKLRRWLEAWIVFRFPAVLWLEQDAVSVSDFDLTPEEREKIVLDKDDEVCYNGAERTSCMPFDEGQGEL